MRNLLNPDRIAQLVPLSAANGNDAAKRTATHEFCTPACSKRGTITQDVEATMQNTPVAIAVSAT
jgi:hypothetical protein